MTVPRAAAGLRAALASLLRVVVAYRSLPRHRRDGVGPSSAPARDCARNLPPRHDGSISQAPRRGDPLRCARHSASPLKITMLVDGVSSVGACECVASLSSLISYAFGTAISGDKASASVFLRIGPMGTLKSPPQSSETSSHGPFKSTERQNVVIRAYHESQM
jgi:hypothetical protein